MMVYFRGWLGHMGGAPHAQSGGSGGLRAWRGDGLAVRTRTASRPPPALGWAPAGSAIGEVGSGALRSEPQE